MITKLTNAFGKVYLTIKVDKTNKWINVIWEGYLSESNIKTGGLAILETIQNTDYSCVLNDMLLVLGPIRTTGWVTDEWTPEVAKAGLRHMALVTAPDAIATADVSDFHSQQSLFQTEVFSNLLEGAEWLKQMCSKNRELLQQS